MEDLKRVFGTLYTEKVLDGIMKEADFNKDERVTLTLILDYL